VITVVSSPGPGVVIGASSARAFRLARRRPRGGWPNLGDRAGLQTISRAELADRLRAQDILVLDIRPEAEYRAGHIAGALPVPPDELRRRLAKLPRDAEIVAYCRGPYCVYADHAVRELQARGQPARRLDDGFPEWANAV
jgi:Rhodanese-related sulfurtransferase